MRVFIVLMLLVAGVPIGVRAAPAETKVLVIPLGPIVEREFSEKMSARLRALKEDRVFSALGSWDRIVELPAWAFEREKREIAFVFGRPLIMHDYRYAVIVSESGELVIVRAGGLSDSYEIFAKKDGPNQPPQRNAGSRPSSMNSSVSETPSSLGPRG